MYSTNSTLFSYYVSLILLLSIIGKGQVAIQYSNSYKTYSVTYLYFALVTGLFNPFK